MKYLEWCFFNEKVRCPLYGHDIEVDGGLCGACIDVATLLGMKASAIVQLMMLFPGDPERAKKAFDEVQEYVKKW